MENHFHLIYERLVLGHWFQPMSGRILQHEVTQLQLCQVSSLILVDFKLIACFLFENG